VNDSLSVTVSVTLNVPNVGYAWVVMASLPPVESPKSQAYETMAPSGSEELEPSKVTVAATSAGFGFAVKEAIGGLPESQYR